MPKLKTKKGVAKRFKISKTGKLGYFPCGKGHLLVNKKKARLRKLRGKRCLDNKKSVALIKTGLPYG